MDGSFTNTQRLVQWHDKAVEPPGDARSDVWFTAHLGLKLKVLYSKSEQSRDRPLQALVWDYVDPVAKPNGEPSAELILKEINGYQFGSSLKDAIPLVSFADLKDDGSTACGAWIYSGIYAPTPEHLKGRNHAANRNGDDWVALGWGF